MIGDERLACWGAEPPKISIEFTATGGYLSIMRRAFIWLLVVGGLAVALSAQAATGRVIKVLPQFLDLKGRNSLTPSLYERDVYQAYLAPEYERVFRDALQRALEGQGRDLGSP